MRSYEILVYEVKYRYTVASAYRLRSPVEEIIVAENNELPRSDMGIIPYVFTGI